ncbi:MAG TPA: PhzF family phenazine biosynthesis protein [Myxococcota bacterium]|nr:PhzF family phenazine biosynthesis protein [Myxococcota bacterium]
MATRPVEIHTIDAFTSEPFAGNPAGVCVLEDARSDRWLQAVAAEMNLSETAFLWPDGAGYRLRWFTPKVEVPLCGHATLASAHLLLETRRARDGAVRFPSQSGELRAVRADDGWIELDLPAFRAEPSLLPANVAVALGVMPIEASTVERLNGTSWLCEMETERDVRGARPDPRALVAAGAPSIMLTTRGDGSGFDFVSRYFAPGAGIDEDPVTGAAHCALAPYWAKKLGKTEMLAYQASVRGGVVGVRVAGDRVVLRGQAVTVVSGQLLK